MRKLAAYPKEALLYFLSECKALRPEDLRSSREQLLSRIAGEKKLGQTIEDFVRFVPIFHDPQFIDCWNAAFPEDGTVCMKTSFGACAYDARGRLIASANNKRIGPCVGIEAPFCNEAHGCIRQNINTRSDQVIGECNHSIVWLLRELFDKGLTPADLGTIRVYEAGFLVSEGFKPWWRKDANYTCLYCVRIFLTFGLFSVWGTLGEKGRAAWVELSVPRDYIELAQKEIRERELR